METKLKESNQSYLTTPAAAPPPREYSTLAKRMNTSEVTDGLVHALGRANGLQAVQHYFRRIKDLDPTTLLDGLLAVFSKRSLTAHDTACAMLWVLDIPYSRELKVDLPELLKNWDLSSEELPWYLLQACGKNNLESAISEMKDEDICSEDQEKLKTIDYWISAPSEYLEEYKNDWKQKLKYC